MNVNLHIYFMSTYMTHSELSIRWSGWLTPSSLLCLPTTLPKTTLAKSVLNLIDQMLSFAFCSIKFSVLSWNFCFVLLKMEVTGFHFSPFFRTNLLITLSFTLIFLFFLTLQGCKMKHKRIGFHHDQNRMQLVVST